jgi:hypothetical protein
MLKYELSLYDFEALSKVLGNVLGHRQTQTLTAQDIAIIDRLKDRFEAAHAVTIETEQE